MTNVFVVNNVESESAEIKGEFSLIGFRNLLVNSDASGDTASIDPAFPIGNLYDYSDNTEMSFSVSAASSTFQLTFTQSSISDVDYFGILSKNAADVNLNLKVEVYDTDNALWNTVAETGGIGNGKPLAVYFGNLAPNGKAFKSNIQRFTFTFSDKLYVTQIYIGKSVVFPFTPSVGFQPGHTANMDKVQNFRTDGNNFIVGRRMKKGFQTRGSINYLLFDELSSYWPEFQAHVLDSKPVFFLWSNTRPKQAVFGLQNPDTLTKPKYSSGLRANIDFEINGYA